MTVTIINKNRDQYIAVNKNVHSYTFYTAGRSIELRVLGNIEKSVLTATMGYYDSEDQCSLKFQELLGFLVTNPDTILIDFSKL